MRKLLLICGIFAPEAEAASPHRLAAGCSVYNEALRALCACREK